MMYNSRAWDAKAVLGKPVEIAWPGQILAAAYLTVPKGTPNKDAAMRLIDYATSAEHNAELSEYFTVAPSNTLSKADPGSRPSYPRRTSTRATRSSTTSGCREPGHGRGGLPGLEVILG